jgi:uncharacterized protein YbjT (DUF2867 family)
VSQLSQGDDSLNGPPGQGPGPRVLVVGASGPTGGAVARAVAGAGATVRAIARSEASETRARGAGASEVVTADLRDPRSLETALEGVDAAFYFSPRAVPDEAALGRAFIRAAEQAGTGKVVIISMIHSHAPIPNHQESLQVEEALGRSPLKGVVLQPGMFMQTLPSLERIADLGWVGRPYPVDKQLAWVDFHDVAEVAVRALLEDVMDNGSFELCSEGMLTIADIAELMSKALDRHVEAKEITLEEWAAVRGEDFSSPYRRECYAQMFEHFARYGFKGGNSFVLSRLLGRPATSFEEYLQRSPARMHTPVGVPAG